MSAADIQLGRARGGRNLLPSSLSSFAPFDRPTALFHDLPTNRASLPPFRTDLAPHFQGLLSKSSLSIENSLQNLLYSSFCLLVVAWESAELPRVVEALLPENECRGGPLALDIVRERITRGTLSIMTFLTQIPISSES